MGDYRIVDWDVSAQTPKPAEMKQHARNDHCISTMSRDKRVYTVYPLPLGSYSCITNVFNFLLDSISRGPMVEHILPNFGQIGQHPNLYYAFSFPVHFSADEHGTLTPSDWDRTLLGIGPFRVPSEVIHVKQLGPSVEKLE